MLVAKILTRDVNFSNGPMKQAVVKPAFLLQLGILLRELVMNLETIRVWEI